MYCLDALPAPPPSFIHPHPQTTLTGGLVFLTDRASRCFTERSRAVVGCALPSPWRHDGIIGFGTSG